MGCSGLPAPPCPTAALVLPRNSVRCGRFHSELGGGEGWRNAVAEGVLRAAAQGAPCSDLLSLLQQIEPGRPSPRRLGGFIFVLLPFSAPPPPFRPPLGAPVAIAPTHWLESPRERARTRAAWRGVSWGGRGCGAGWGRRSASSGGSALVVREGSEGNPPLGARPVAERRQLAVPLVEPPQVASPGEPQQRHVVARLHPQPPSQQARPGEQPPDS